MKHWSRHPLAIKGVLTLLVGLILAFSVYAVFRLKSASRTAETKVAAPSENVEVELITILPNGFEPGELVRPADSFVLMFDNQSGLEPLDLRLERTGMPRVSELHLRRKTDSTKILNLPQGEYQVTEASHPEWNLKLTLTRR
jgi:hypothetical protein